MKKVPCDPQIGSDVEVFLFSNEQDRIVPCVGIIDGTKVKPFQAPDFMAGFMLQEDNVMLEYNIPPAKSIRTWCDRFTSAHEMLAKYIPAKHSFRIQVENTFLARDLMSDQAKVIGCEPDFNAYEGGEERAFQGELGRKRSCGGHIHLGGNFNCPDFAAALFADLMIGVMSQTHPRRVNSRTEWYGRPGIFRPKPYGVEYRTPDNLWTNDVDKIYRVGANALQLVKWLTETEAALIRTVFKAINWPRVRDYMTPSTKVDRGVLYRDIQLEAMAHGVPAV